MRLKVITIFLLVLNFLISSIAEARMFGQALCKEPGYTCQRIKRNQSWRSLFPDDQQRDIVMRINRMNTAVWPGMVIAVPKNLAHGNIMQYSPFPEQIDAPGEKIVTVDPVLLAWGAYTPEGTLIKWGPISAGADWCNDIDDICQTHPGSFRVFSLGSSGCISHKFPLPYGGAPMPYCMYFNNGQALHGEPNGLPGYNASHGCVRLFVNDAEWLRYSFIEGPNSYNDFRGTKIVIATY